ncbi:flagellar hook-basal body complex protein FliE [Nocardioides sp. CN2-186]|uniref:flagellar hook-basal body complex protein FliE n=1 Tax=Nocardioides tweenelious TaxID=3156607 RepID=UPI0032B59691
MSVSGIEAVGFTPYVPPQLPSTDATHGVSGAGSSFSDMVLNGIDHLESVQDKSDKLAVQAATGDLDNIHDYTIAATEASVTAQLTVAVRNRALEAFNEIMRMPIG